VARAATFALTLLAVTAVHSEPPRIALAAFVKREAFSLPRLSPDGEHLVVSKRIQGDGRDITVIAVIAVAQMKIVSEVRLPVFEVPAHYVWITNSRLGIATAREFGSLERPQLTGEVLAMDIDGTHQEYLYGYKQGRLKDAAILRRGVPIVPDRGWGWINSVPPALNGHFLLTEHLWGVKEQNSLLYDIDSGSTKRRLVTSIDKQEFTFLVQRDGKPRFAYGTDQDSEPAVFEYVEETSSWRSVLGPGKPGFEPLALADDNREVYGYMFRKNGPGVLVRRRLPDGEPVVLAQDAIGSIDTVEWGPRQAAPFAAATSVGIPQPVYFDAQRPEAALHKALSAQFPGSYVHFIDYSNDGAKLLFLVASDRDPGVYYLFDRGANKAYHLFDVSPWIDPAKMAAQRPIHFTASDGLEIHGYLTLPTPAGDAKPPLILLPHGGPHGVADDWFFDRDVQFLASRGYAVLQVNYRGSRGRGSDFQKAGYRQWGGRIQQDLLDGVRWAAAQGNVDAGRICAYGGSFGAYSAMMTTIRAPGLFKCAVGYAGLYDLPMWYSTDETIESKQLFNYLVKVIGQDPAELANNSPDRLADKLTVPVLLVHGSEDRRTPPEQFKAMRDALKKAGRPPDTLYVDGEGHGFYTEKNRQAFYEKLEAFLAKHLAP
jgi:dipeptidyl aminopeptidase/acylaminoacyl peptidase